jgi:hypothetical protein
MSDLPRRSPSSSDPAEPEDPPKDKGPNLFILYALLALGLLGAMAVAAAIVYPFYQRR